MKLAVLVDVLDVLAGAQFGVLVCLSTSTPRTSLALPRTYIRIDDSYIPSDLKKLGSKSNENLFCK